LSWKIRKVRRRKHNKMTNYLGKKEKKRNKKMKRRPIWMKWIPCKISKRQERLFPRYKK
jgi:hypothetical protein